MRLLAIGLWCVASAACAHATSAVPGPAKQAETPARSANRFASPYTYEWFVRAELLRANGQLEQAIEAYRAALAGADEEPELLARLATALDEHGDHARALELLDEALPLDPHSEATWLARGEVLARAARLDEAIAAYEEAENAAPHSPRAPLALAQLLRERAGPERADAVLFRFEARSLPGAAGAYQARLSRALASGEMAQVFEATQPYRLGLVPASGGLVLDAARRLLERGHAAEALQVLAVAPPTPLSAALELRALLAVGSSAELAAWLAQHEPTDPDQRLLAARAQLQLGHPDAATALIEADVLLRPDLPDLQLTAADVELERGHYASAAEAYARIPRTSSAGAAARASLARALTALGMPGIAAELAQ